MILHLYDQIGNIVKNARNAFEKWRELEILERCDYIRNLAKSSVRIRKDMPNDHRRDG